MKQKIMDRKLSERQQRFVNEYKIDCIGRQAALRAGYSESSAESVALRLLDDPRVKAAIAEHQEQLRQECNTTELQIVRELERIAFSDIRNHLNVDAKTGAVSTKGFDEMPPDSSRAIESIQEDRLKARYRFKLHDKLKALELLGRHLGMFKDKVDFTGKIDGPAVFMMPRPGKK